MPIDWRSFPSLAALRAFEATAAHDGFSGAARALNVTPAAVAQQVRALERELGLRLAVRAGRNVTLTDAGRDLARGLSQGFGGIEACLADLRTQEARRGVRVTTTQFLADAVILPNLADFWQTYPGTEITLNPTRENTDILRDGYDLAIRALFDYAEPDWAGVDSRHLMNVQLVGIASTDLLARRGRDAARLPWIRHEGMHVKQRIMQSAGLRTEALEWVAIGGPNLQLEAVRHGIGVTIFNERIVRDDLAAGRLVTFPLPREPVASYYALTPKGVRRKQVEQFLDWLIPLM